MNREDMIRMAKEAGFERLGHTDNDWVCYPEDIERFATLVAKHTLANIDPSSFMTWQEGYEVGKQTEREACAALCFDIWNRWLDSPEEDRHKMLYDAEDCAAAIRARGQA